MGKYETETDYYSACFDEEDDEQNDENPTINYDLYANPETEAKNWLNQYASCHVAPYCRKLKIRFMTHEGYVFQKIKSKTINGPIVMEDVIYEIKCLENNGSWRIFDKYRGDDNYSFTMFKLDKCFINKKQDYIFNVLFHYYG
jgi:hypothetical protein